MNQRKAIRFINESGVLLVFPINNRKEPHSLWSKFFPRKKMKWEWDDNGDDSVADMWMLMKRLSDNPEVVYSKWYQGRATFFSRDLFKAMLRVYQEQPNMREPHGQSAKTLMDALENNSPLSTKVLKKETDMQGKLYESQYQRGLKELFSKLLVVGFGEVDDGAFPSLAVGSTKLLHESLWLESSELPLKAALTTVDQFMPLGSHFRKSFEKLKSF